ncbi:MAG: S-layer homology domain-containing protein [Clostridia bacterium]|nr:S-layer homology domain-containing protein [Clostridia bacterium]
MLKKLISGILSFALVLSTMITISAAQSTADVSILQQGYNIIATVESDIKLGTVTAFVRGTGADNNYYGVSQTDTYVKASGKYVYTLTFPTLDTMQTGTYELVLGDKFRTEKEFSFCIVSDIIDFYDSLNVALTEDIDALINGGTNCLVYDFTEYNELDDSIRLLVDGEISGWNLDAEPNNVNNIEKTFFSKMDEVMLRANVANGTEENFDDNVEALIASNTLSRGKYNGADPDVVCSYIDTESVTTLEKTKLNKLFANAVLLAIADESDYLTLYNATLYYAQNSMINISSAKLTSLKNNNAHFDVFSELKNSSYATISEFETAVNTKVDAKLSSIGTGPSAGAGNSGGNGGGGSITPGQGVGSGTTVVTPPDGTNKDDGKIDNPPQFKDLASASWAEEAITYLAERGIVNGRSEDKFAPNDTLTREELVKLVVEALSNKGKDVTCDFDDVAENRWSYPYIATAEHLGIVTGVDSNSFNPAGKMTREDLAVIIYRAYKLTGQKVNNTSNKFADKSKISSYAQEAVGALTNLGIVNGMGNNTFEPKGIVTRAQAAKVIYELLTVIGGAK